MLIAANLVQYKNGAWTYVYCPEIHICGFGELLKDAELDFYKLYPIRLESMVRESCLVKYLIEQAAWVNDNNIRLLPPLYTPDEALKITERRMEYAMHTINVVSCDLIIPLYYAPCNGNKATTG